MQPESTIRRARRLRKAPTGTETVLWDHLRDRRQAELRFRRQVPIGDFVVDFACLSIRLVVEVDGGIHDLRTFDDARRDAWLRGRNFTVLRFTNGQIRHAINDVLAEIRRHAPSPISGEGGPRSGSDGGCPSQSDSQPFVTRTEPPSVRLRLPPSPEMGEGSGLSGLQSKTVQREVIDAAD